MKTHIIAAISGAAAAIVVLVLFSFSQQAEEKADNKVYADHMRDNYRIFTLPLPDSLSFAGEMVPMEEWDLRERLDREMLVNTYWHSNTLLSIKRANRWFPVIEPILKKNGIPDDFKYLALVESALVQAVSPNLAVGFWQFLEATGKEYDLEINDEVDERYHVERSTEAACHYLKDSFDRYGSWAMAAASYNMGKGGLNTQVERQNQTEYWDLLLNEETGRYVFRIIAMKEIVNHADQYGFVIRPGDLYPPLKYDIVTVDSAILDFAVFAEQQHITYKELKLYNPWLRQPYLKNKLKEIYEIKILKE
ncbi:MAG: lytic transglycosylase domain-containing protein [Flavobacteriales bacterium]|nr:lytic transglycosylase domain-containing protein [Flavobacteriales bacterium]